MGFLRRHMKSIEHLHGKMTRWSMNRQMVSVALLATLATLLQSAGGYIPVFGFFISPFTTLPILIARLISLRYGLLSYGLTVLLLLIIEPTELFIYLQLGCSV